MKGKKAIISASMATVITLIYTMFVWKVDVSQLGETNTQVGLSGLNKLMMNDYNEFWYKMSEIIGYASLLLIVLMAIMGIVQLIQRRSLFQVDSKIIGAGIIFILTFMFYFIFNKVAINYRPVILPGETDFESSYPSSHTMMAMVVFGVAMVLISDFIEKEKMRKLMKLIFVLMIFITVFSRLLSGAHWFTDIIGGVLFGITLILWYGVIVEIVEKKFGE